MIGQAQSFVATMADAICSQASSEALDTALAIVSEVAKRKRLEAIRNFARGRVPSHESRPMQVIAAVCQQFGITSEEMLSVSHAKRFADPRAVAMRIMRHELRMGTPEIARLFRRDSSTVTHATTKERPDLAAHATRITGWLRIQWGSEQVVEAAE